MTLTTVILTFNEERHIARAIGAVAAVSDRVVVVDSGSTDGTVDIATTLGAQVLVHPFVTQARQFNWALSQLPADTDWVFRLDADEVVSPALAQSLAAFVAQDGAGAAGAEVLRRIAFLGRPIRWGGLFPVPIVRVLRFGKGRSEDRWMDEHILLDGPVAALKGELLDDNLNSLTWWTAQHNAYASREVVELLDLEHGFLQRGTANTLGGGQAGLKRWLKEKVYSRLPGGLRALVYFLYRYLLRAGFLDGREGFAFHVLQGFWYRFLVDTKLSEVRAYMARQSCSAPDAIEAVLGIDVTR